MASNVFYFSTVVVCSIAYKQDAVIIGSDSDIQTEREGDIQIERDGDIQTNAEEKERFSDVNVNGKERHDESDWLETEEDSLIDTGDQRNVDNELRDEEDEVKSADNHSHNEDEKIANSDDKLEEKDYVTDSSKEDEKMAVDEENPKTNRRRNVMIVAKDDNKEDGEEQSDEFEELNNKRKLIQLLTEQLEVVEKFLNYTNDGKKIERQRRSDFDDLLESIKKKRNTTRTTTAVTETQTEPTTTVMTVIDEVKVREALRKNPLVMRIIQMAKRKREKYLNEVKKNNQKNP